MLIHTVYRPEENIDYLKDWLIHHTAIGVTHFYLYDNGGANGYIDSGLKVPDGENKHGTIIKYSVEEARELEKDIIKDFPVTKIMWQNRNSKGELLYDQAKSVIHFKNMVKSGLCAFIDIDEFIIPQEEFRPCRMLQKKFKSRVYYKSVYDCLETWPVDTSDWGPKVIIDMANFPEFSIKAKHDIHFRHVNLPISKTWFNHYNNTVHTHQFILNTQKDNECIGHIVQNILNTHDISDFEKHFDSLYMKIGTCQLRRTNKERANFFWHGNPLSLYEQLCISSFVKHGFEVNVWSFMDLDVPEGAVLKDASEILPKDWLFKYTQGGKQGCIAAFSDVFRLVLIYKNPGVWWFDADCICLKDESEYAKLKEGKTVVAGWEDEKHNSVGIGALTITDPSTAFSLVCEQKKICDELIDIPWAEIGPRLVTRYFEKHNMSNQFFETDVFYPIDYYKWDLIYDVDLTESLLDKCKDAYMHHLWNDALKGHIDKNSIPPKGSFMYLMFERYLPKALETDTL